MKVKDKDVLQIVLAAVEGANRVLVHVHFQLDITRETWHASNKLDTRTDFVTRGENDQMIDINKTSAHTRTFISRLPHRHRQTCFVISVNQITASVAICKTQC